MKNEGRTWLHLPSMEYHHHLVLSMLPFFLSISSFAAASQYRVGDSVWSIPPYPNYYSVWSSQQHLVIHDTLCFEFETGSHDVMQVSKLDYTSCTTTNPYQAYREGPAKVRLIEKGVLYFICNVSDYCFLGQKVTVAVNEQAPRNDTTTPPYPSPSPFPNRVMPRSMAPTISPSPVSGPGFSIPRPEGSNFSLRGVLLVMILMVVVSIVVCT